MYPKSFTSQRKKLLEIFAENDDKIRYKNLSYKILFPDSTFHIINFLNKYVTLFSLLEGLVTRKMTLNNANADQISFMINLMHGYDEGKLYDIKELKSRFFRNTILTKASDVFLNTKKNPKKEIKSFFPKNFKEIISKEKTNVLLNAMQLYNYRNKIIRLLENKYIRPSVYAHNDGAKKSGQKFDESIGEKVKLRRQKADDKKDETGDEQLDTTDMPELESEKSAEQKRKTKGQ